jgi:hypothetical protein
MHDFLIANKNELRLTLLTKERDLRRGPFIIESQDALLEEQKLALRLILAEHFPNVTYNVIYQFVDKEVINWILTTS